MTITITVPIRLVSEANARCHWAVRHRRFKAQAAAVGNHLMVHRVPRTPPMSVTITRVGPKMLDDDNCVGSAKGVRDLLAKWFGVDDGDGSIAWRVEQDQGAYAARIAMTWDASVVAAGGSVRRAKR